MFSNLYRYFTIEIITEKYIGSRSVSDTTAKFEEYLFTPKIYFRKLTCDLSVILILYINGNNKFSSFLQAFMLVLKTPQISESNGRMDVNLF